MSDPEIEDLRDKVHCAVVLERMPPSWKLDRKQSTKLSLKYRRGKGEILIVSQAGKADGIRPATPRALGLLFAPALPADREAAALQGRAERAGARDEPFRRGRR